MKTAPKETTRDETDLNDKIICLQNNASTNISKFVVMLSARYAC